MAKPSRPAGAAESQNLKCSCGDAGVQTPYGTKCVGCYLELAEGLIPDMKTVTSSHAPVTRKWAFVRRRNGVGRRNISRGDYFGDCYE
jgi:hypothetical protein